MEYTHYTTGIGDRWDIVAAKMYGDSTRIKELIAANPNVPIISPLPIGIKINVPILPDINTEEDKLPEWKR